MNKLDFAKHDNEIINKLKERINNIEEYLKRKDLSEEAKENMYGQKVAYKEAVKIIQEIFYKECVNEIINNK